MKKNIIATTAGHQFVLGSRYMYEDTKCYGARHIKRSDIKKFFINNAQSVNVHYSHMSDVVNFYIYRLGDRLEAGCMEFSTATVKKIRTWAVKHGR